MIDSLAKCCGTNLRGDAFDAAVVDVGPALLDGAPGVALALGQAGFDQGVDDVQAAPPSRSRGKSRLGTSAKISPNCASDNWSISAPKKISVARRAAAGRVRRGPAASVPRPGGAGFARSWGCGVRRRALRSLRVPVRSGYRRQLPASASSTLNQY